MSQKSHVGEKYWPIVERYFAFQFINMFVDDTLELKLVCTKNIQHDKVDFGHQFRLYSYM